MRFADLLLVPALWTLLDPAVVVARPQDADGPSPPRRGVQAPEDSSATGSRARGQGLSLVDWRVWGPLGVAVLSIGGSYVISNHRVAKLRKETEADMQKFREDLRKMDEARGDELARLDEERRDAYDMVGNVQADLGEINRALLTTDFAEFSREYRKAEACILTVLGVFDVPDRIRWVNGDDFVRAAERCGLSVKWKARYVPIRLAVPKGMQPVAQPPRSGEGPGEQKPGAQPSKFTLSPGNVFNRVRKSFGRAFKGPDVPAGRGWRGAPLARPVPGIP